MDDEFDRKRFKEYLKYIKNSLEAYESEMTIIDMDNRQIYKDEPNKEVLDRLSLVIHDVEAFYSYIISIDTEE